MASADATPLEPRQRVPGGPTGGVSVLLHAGDEPDFASSSRQTAHVAYPSGDAVVVTEIRAGIASPSPHVLRPSGDRTRPVTFVSWAPGDAHRGLLAVGTRDELRLYAPPADDSPPSSPAGDDPDLLLHHRDDLVDASDDSSRWILLDRVALDADVTCAAWTHDAEGIVLATASGFVGACRLRRPEDGRPGDGRPEDGRPGDDIPETGDYQVQSRWSWRGRASEPQALVAAGPTLDAAAATAAEASLRAVAWRPDPDVNSGEMAPHPETRRAEHLKHPSPVTSLSWRPSPSGETAPHPEEEALMTTCADGAIRVWTRPPAGFAADARGSRALVLAFVAQADARTSGEDPPAVFGARWVRVETSRGRRRRGARRRGVRGRDGARVVDRGWRPGVRARAARARVGNRAVSVGARRASECGDARGVCVDARADVGV